MCVNIFFGIGGTYMFRSASTHMLIQIYILYLHSTPYANYLDWKTLTDAALPALELHCTSQWQLFLHAGMLTYCSLCLSIKATLAIPTPNFTVITICMYLLASAMVCRRIHVCKNWSLKLKLKGATQQWTNVHKHMDAHCNLHSMVHGGCGGIHISYTTRKCST